MNKKELLILIKNKFSMYEYGTNESKTLNKIYSKYCRELNLNLTSDGKSAKCYFPISLSKSELVQINNILDIAIDVVEG